MSKDHGGHNKAAAPAAGGTIYTCPMHPEVRQDQPGNCPKCGMTLMPEAAAAAPASGTEAAPGAKTYTCPMHPEVRQDKPGSCPKCGMTLMPEAAAAAPAGGTEAAPGAKTYTCPMHPEVRQDKPGSCPKCGMTLMPETGEGPAAVPAGAPAGQAEGAMSGHAMSGHGGHSMSGHGMSHGAAAAGTGDMMGDMHRAMLWPHYVAIMVGFWMIAAPLTLGYQSDFVPDANQLAVMADRGLSPFAHRNMLMTVNDFVTGALIVIFGALSADSRRRFPWAQWANAFVGGWLLLAPLFIWTPLPEAYANSTLVGAMVIALSVLIPMMPGMSMEGMMGKPDIPPEWSYCPSTWLQRVPIVALALFGFLIARYMSAYQMGHIDTVWEPFFPGTDPASGLNGTEAIITSSVSKAWPMPDAGLGAVVYALEIVMTFMGGKDRWRTMPWMVLALALLILPLGIVSIYFVIIQPIEIGTWCTLCLIAALAMALMIPYSVDEFVAMGQFLTWSRRNGKPFWRSFWTGGAMEGGSDDRAPGVLAPRSQMFAQGGRGVTYPPTLLAVCAIGIWLTFTRMTFGNSGAMANSDHLIGLLIVTFTIISLAEVARPVRFLNVPFGLWLIVAPFVLDGAGSPVATWAGVATGLAVVALSLPRGSIRNSYGGWNVVMV